MGRGSLEVEFQIERLCLIVLRMDEESPQTGDFRSLGRAQEGILEQSFAQPLSLFGPIDGKSSQKHHGKRMARHAICECVLALRRVSPRHKQGCNTRRPGNRATQHRCGRTRFQHSPRNACSGSRSVPRRRNRTRTSRALPSAQLGLTAARQASKTLGSVNRRRRFGLSRGGSSRRRQKASHCLGPREKESSKRFPRGPAGWNSPGRTVKGRDGAAGRLVRAAACAGATSECESWRSWCRLGP